MIAPTRGAIDLQPGQVVAMRLEQRRATGWTIDRADLA